MTGCYHKPCNIVIFFTIYCDIIILCHPVLYTVQTFRPFKPGCCIKHLLSSWLVISHIRQASIYACNFACNIYLCIFQKYLNTAQNMFLQMHQGRCQLFCCPTVKQCVMYQLRVDTIQRKTLAGENIGEFGGLIYNCQSFLPQKILSLFFKSYGELNSPKFCTPSNPNS